MNLSDSSKPAAAQPQTYLPDWTAQAANTNERTITHHETRTQIYKLVEAQERLSDVRHELLVKRENIRRSQNKVRGKRDIARSTTVEFMNELRKFIHEDFQLQIPDALRVAYGKMQDSHDELGPLEEEQLTKERALSGHEWRLHEMETDLYQYDLKDVLPDPAIACQCLSSSDITDTAEHQLPQSQLLQHRYLPVKRSILTEATAFRLRPSDMEDATVISPPHARHARFPRSLSTVQSLPTIPQYPQSRPDIETERQFAAVNLELGELRRQLESLRREHTAWPVNQTAPSPSESVIHSNNEATLDSVTKKTSDLLGKIADCEVQAQKLRKDMGVPDSPTFGATIIQDALANNHSSGSPNRLPFDVAARRKVRDWLLTNLRENSAQKILYSSILQSCGIDDANGDGFDDRVIDNWSLDSASTRGYNHTDERPASSRDPDDSS